MTKTGKFLLALDLCAIGYLSLLFSLTLCRPMFAAARPDAITLTARKHGIPPAELRALVQIESSGNPRALSRSGAVGLTQLMPRTAKWFCNLSGYDLWNPARNLDCGASYYAMLRRKYGCPVLAIAAYHSGPGAVDRAGGVPSTSDRHVGKFLAARGGLTL